MAGEIGHLRLGSHIDEVSRHQDTGQLSFRGLLQLGEDLLEFCFRAVPVSYVRVADNSQGQDDGIFVKTGGLLPAGKKKGKG